MAKHTARTGSAREDGARPEIDMTAAQMRRLIGERLEYERLAAGIKQADMARDLGLTQKTYARYEDGLQSLPAEYIPFIAQRLGISVARLFGQRVWCAVKFWEGVLV